MMMMSLIVSQGMNQFNLYAEWIIDSLFYLTLRLSYVFLMLLLEWLRNLAMGNTSLSLF